MLVELSAQSAERTPPGLAAFHGRIAEIAVGVPAAHRTAIASFLQAAAGAAADAAAELRR